MATYHPSFSYKRDDLSTTHLGDQKPVSYLGSSSDPSNSTIYLNHASSAGAYSEILSGTSLSLENCVQIPSVGGRNEMSFIPPSSDTVSLQSVDGQLNITTGNSVCNPVAANPPTIPRSVLDEQSSQSQGLALSLGSQISSGVSMPSFQHQYQGYSSFFSGHLPCAGEENKRSKELKTSDDMQCGFPGGNNDAFEIHLLSNPQGSISHKQMHSDIYHFDSGFTSTILNSKYLRVAQELLDEVINVRKALKQPDLDKNVTSQPNPSNGISSEPSESANNSSPEKSPAERQDLQNKKTKLLSILDEVDRRYKQYYHQMKIVVSSFDMVAGCGAAKPYTALALKTISRHFRSLRDAITGQIQLTQRSLGEQDNSSNNLGGAIPRLRYVDHQLRQQRALHQQLGVMRNAWRPQRGLPESSVSILRAWLFEHFLHPYPKDSEKIMLAKQTGLTRNQVANWFINARVRLWKPMIEEMYKEEFGEMDSHFKSSLENAAKATRENSSASEDRGEELRERMTSKVANADQPGQVQDVKPDHIADVELNRPVARSMFQNIAIGDAGSHSGMKLLVDQMSNMESNNPYQDMVIPSGQHGHGTLMAGDAMYDLTELSGFSVSGQVSLALGLRHHENNIFPMPGETNMRGNNKVASSVSPETVDFHCMEPGIQQDRFGNPHILHDFVV